MYNKVSPVMIAVLSIGIILVVVLAFALLFTNNSGGENNVVQPEISQVLPVLDLSLDNEEENQETVTITAVATTEDELGIQFITLPDGSTKRAESVTFAVTKNGNYTFKAKGNNGQTASLTIEVNNIREASAATPYIPTGFSHVEGEPENGYVIQDGYGNQFVWVPVESGKLTRNTLLDTDYQESNSTATALVNSVAQNYGFYIARYESSSYDINGQTVSASMGNKTPWTNVTYVVAANAASKAGSAFGYEDCQTAIMNSYAWDTTITWLDKYFENYSTSTSYGNYSGTLRTTGGTESDIKNNICDIAGNVREWTTEIYKVQTAPTNTKNKNKTNQAVVSETVNYRVIRGGSATLSKTASGHTGYKENSSDAYWGFRMILYK